MNVEIETEVPIFLFWEDLFQIFGILSLQCMCRSFPKEGCQAGESNPGLPYSSPARYQLNHAALFC